MQTRTIQTIHYFSMSYFFSNLSVDDICITFNLIDNCRQKLDRYYFLVRKYASMYTKGTFFLPLPTESYL